MAPFLLLHCLPVTILAKKICIYMRNKLTERKMKLYKKYSEDHIALHGYKKINCEHIRAVSPSTLE